jgi:hypothetical chaperone protein
LVSAAATVVDGNLEIIKFDGKDQFRTAVYFPEEIPSIDAFVLSPKDERQITSLVAQSRKEETEVIKRTSTLH